jgi:pimeloyl-ACP methyl ester carboxylesterase
VLLCLPGLLETRATFDPVLSLAQGVAGMRVIALDHCGRGDSDPLPGDAGYTMSVYLQDIVQFLRQEVMQPGQPVPRIEVLGTSMGGILAMYLASDPHNGIEGLFFNDIGLNLSWMSIYSLSDHLKQAGRMPEPQALVQQLGVQLGVVLAVQSPSHFDLPYRKDWKGMKFGHLLKSFQGPLRLIYGSASGVCLSEQVRELQRHHPRCSVFEVLGAKHPAPFNEAVCQFVLRELQRVPSAPVHDALHAGDHAHGFWPWLKRRYLGATAK